MSDKRWVEEFLYRGRAPGSGVDPAWHVTVGAIVDDGFGGQTTVTRGPLTIDQAEEMGFELPVILAEINDDLMREVVSLQAELEATRAELDAERAERRQAEIPPDQEYWQRLADSLTTLFVSWEDSTVSAGDVAQFVATLITTITVSFVAEIFFPWSSRMFT